MIHAAHILILCLFIFANSTALATPPNLACLSNLTKEQALSQSNTQDSIVLFAGDTPETNAWSTSIWDDPAFAAHLKASNITVVNTTEHPSNYYANPIRPTELPAFFYYHQGKITTKRSGLPPATEETRADYINWINAAKSAAPLSQHFIAQLKDDPDNFKLRFQLLDEFENESNLAAYYQQICWIFDHNEPWHQYEINHDLFDPDLYPDPELYTRAAVIQYTHQPRKRLNLRQRNSIDGWNQAIQESDQALLATDYDRARAAFVNLRQTLEARRDTNTATDRDLFILHALTAEGEEWQQLVKEHKPYYT